MPLAPAHESRRNAPYHRVGFHRPSDDRPGHHHRSSTDVRASRDHNVGRYPDIVFDNDWFVLAILQPYRHVKAVEIVIERLDNHVSRHPDVIADVNWTSANVASVPNRDAVTHTQGSSIINAHTRPKHDSFTTPSEKSSGNKTPQTKRKAALDWL